MFGLGFQELLLIVLVVLLFFGGKKVPEMMKGLGKGVKSFRDRINGKEDEKTTDTHKQTSEKADDGAK